MEANFSDLIGKTIGLFENSYDEIRIHCTDGTKYQMFHSQDCCESVIVEDIVGDIADILNSPILLAEEVTNSEDTFGKQMYDSFTWTFYKLSTIKGSVTIRWLGESNGYNSERVDFVKCN